MSQSVPVERFAHGMYCYARDYDRLKEAFDDRVRVIEMQLRDKEVLLAKYNGAVALLREVSEETRSACPCGDDCCFESRVPTRLAMLARAWFRDNQEAV